MDSSDWALLLGTLGGGLGGYLGGQKRAERAKSQSDSEFENWKKMVDYERELAAEDRARAKEEAEIAQLESEGRITEGERRGELVDPNSLSNMIFNPGESDPWWETIAGGAEPTSEWRKNMADVLLGTRDYDDPNIRNKENEAFVANPDQNWFNDMSPLMWASMFVPGVGPAALMGRLGLAGAKGLGSLGPRMMGGLSKYLGGGRGATSIPSVSSNPSRLIPNASVYNQGGRVGYDNGGSIEDLLAEHGTLMHEDALGSFGINKGPILPGQSPGFMSAVGDIFTPNALVEQFRNLFGMETDYEKMLKELDEAGMTEYDLMKQMLED